MTKYYCKLCGIEFEVEDGEEPVCPVCGAKNHHWNMFRCLMYVVLAIVLLCIAYGFVQAMIQDLMGK